MAASPEAVEAVEVRVYDLVAEGLSQAAAEATVHAVK